MKTEYLYGVDVIVPDIPKNVIDERVVLLNSNLTKLLSVGYLKRDQVRVNAVLKAINFWTKDVKC